MTRDEAGGEVEAVVLSGGGAFAAYEAGVVNVLLEGGSPSTGGRPVDPGIVTGTSAGAFNAALLAASWQATRAETAAFLERSWLEEIAQGPDACDDGGVLRWRGTPFNFFDLGCLAADPLRFAADRARDAAFFAGDFLRRADHFARSDGPLEARVLELVDFSTLISTAPFPVTIRRVVPLAAIRSSPRLLRVPATNFDTGELQIFTNEDMTEERGDLILMASSAAPGVFPPVAIPPFTYIDGGVLMNTPLRPAIHAGATTLHAVYIDPDVRYIPTSDLQTTMGTLQRIMAIATAANFNHDAEMACRINEGLAALKRPGAARGAPARPLLEAARQAAQDQPYRELTIHRYHPPDVLGGPLGFLDFRRATLEALIERGKRDALAHDCAASGCVLPLGAGGGAAA